MPNADTSYQCGTFIVFSKLWCKIFSGIFFRIRTNKELNNKYSKYKRLNFNLKLKKVNRFVKRHVVFPVHNQFIQPQLKRQSFCCYFGTFFLTKDAVLIRDLDELNLVFLGYAVCLTNFFLLPQLSQIMILTSKVGKSDSKIIISLC